MFYHRLLFILGTFGTVAAMHGQELAATLSAVDHNGYHVSCFGVKDGQVTVTATGGTTPYTYDWSTGGNTATVTELATGYLKVKVSDAVGAVVIKEITLMGPDQMKVELIPFKYPSGKNISCYECFNGSVDLEVQGGVQPYSYTWNDDITTQDRSGLGAMAYDVRVEDANGCTKTGNITMEQPEKATWGMVGNANTIPGTHYIGSSDNNDVVFKSNGSEVLRLKANGDIGLLGSLTEEGVLYRGADGTLRGLTEPVDPVTVGPCSNAPFPYPIWLTQGNWFPALCNGVQPLLGTKSNDPLKIITNNVERMRITTLGKVGIGTDLPNDQLTVSGAARPSISLQTSDVNSASGSLYYRRSNGTPSWELATDLTGTGGQNFYIRDKVANANRIYIDEEGRVAIGNVTTPAGAPGYKLAVEEGIITDRLKVAIHTSGDWNDHVFDPAYELMTLSDVKRYVMKERHLPEVPSANELVCTGLDVAKMDALLMKKVEELTMHLIAFEERILELEKENTLLRGKVEVLATKAAKQ